ncbi:hypothetical protein [Microseira wollei]|uniref:Uncharacterized protein n=1 Tax=Microseira wollei NIES-4236 TaxID=2530354 RepID=A0AAV3XDK0_9CYAN|nr:hypothetical protein [Microseira wollei]GET39481.1 hypothetical protein MiSe_42500 [Microseira wollei NIES-4236]
MMQFTKEELTFAIAALSGIKCCASTFITQIEDAVTKCGVSRIANQPDYGCDPETLLEKLESCSFEEKDQLFSKIEAICKTPGASLPNEAELKAAGLL